MNNSTERFFELATDLLVVGTVEGRFIKFSDSWSRVLGWSAEELIELSVPELLHPDDLEKSFEIREKALQGSKVFHFNNRYRHKNGSWRWLTWNGVYCPIDQLFYCLATDTTDQLNMEKRLRLSERRLATAQQIANIGSWELDLSNLEDINSNPLYWSDQAYRIFGFEPGKVEASNELFFKSVHPDDRDKITKAVAEALRTQTNYDLEHRIVLPNGTERIVHELSQIVFDEKSGAPVLMAGTVQDITEKKKLLNQLTAAQKMESLGRFTGGIAHDFNNMLTAIYGNLDAMALLLAENHPATKYLKSIQTTARRAEELVDQLMAFSRQRALAPTVQDLNALIVETTKILSRVLGADIEVTVSTLASLGKIEVDPSQVTQIVLNLALNARDAMPKGGTLSLATSQVNVSEYSSLNLRPGNYARLTVTDTGHGMTPDVLEKIFEPFFTTKQPGKGTGLGLSTVYGIVRQSGGMILVESQPSKGTKFEIFLPITTNVVASEGTVSAGAKQRLLLGKGQSILLVEDERELRLILQETLEQNGYIVRAVNCGKSALASINDPATKIDLLLTDIGLPGINGVDLIRQARLIRPKIPVVCMSGYLPEGIDFPAGDPSTLHLSKPFSFAAVVEQVHQLLELAKTVTTSPPGFT